MAWVRTVGEEGATGKLADLYRRVRERAGSVPNIVKLQSLRPATTEFSELLPIRTLAADNENAREYRAWHRTIECRDR